MTFKGGSLGSGEQLTVYHKRTTYEGPRRRRFGSQSALPQALQMLTDQELDSRNARVWSTVLTDCQAIVGMGPDLAPNLRYGGRGGETQSEVRLAVRVAVWICLEKFGIPITRLRDLSESCIRSLNEWRQWVPTNDEAQRIVMQWETSGGAQRVEETEMRLLAVPGCLLESLTRAAAEHDTTIPALLARLLDES